MVTHLSTSLKICLVFRLVELGLGLEFGPRIGLAEGSPIRLLAFLCFA